MNKYILKVIRYLDNPELFSDEEMLENTNAATDASKRAADADAKAAYAAYAVCSYTIEVDVPRVERWLSKYFKISGENKQNYVNEVERLK